MQIRESTPVRCDVSSESGRGGINRLPVRSVLQVIKVQWSTQHYLEVSLKDLVFTHLDMNDFKDDALRVIKKRNHVIDLGKLLLS